MGPVCDLEVDVNGEEVFLVDKETLSSFSGRLRKLFSKSAAATMPTSNLKVIFHDLPGGAEAFELMTRFCYNHGSLQITPTNVCLLHCVAHFMEMTEAISCSCNLIEQTEKFLEGITYWTWSEILIALKQCQDLLPAATSIGLLKKCLDSLVAKVASTSDTSPSTSSPDSITFRFSCDTRSTESTKVGYTRCWWFEELTGFNTSILRKIIDTMSSQKFDQVIISRFLFFYLKSQISSAKSNEKREIIETVVDLLFLLDRGSVSCKGLFSMLPLVSGVTLSKCCRSRLENMIGSQLDQAKLDNLLVPAPAGVKFLYDVNLVLRFLKSFLSSSVRISSTRLRRVGRLIDMYIVEVAPDSCLKPSKFISLLMALPDSARDNHDEIYRAVDMYLEVHSGLSEKDKVKICFALNYEKLSSETCKLLAQNPKFPARTTIQALLVQQSKLKSLLQDTDHLKSSDGSVCDCSDKASLGKNDEQVVLYAKKLDLSVENEKMKTHLQGMQWRVMELEKVCKKMQTQIAKLMKTRVATPSTPKSLPRLCS